MSAFYDLNKTPRNILNQAIVRAIISENNGAWFDPSDLSTLFQDAAGTVPVTAVEQPVGLVLDKSQGLGLGPELVTNGDFSNGFVGWGVTAAYITVNSGIIRVTNTTTNYGFARQLIPTVIGKTYIFTGVCIGGTGNTSIVKIGSLNYSKSSLESGIKFVATSTSTQIQLNVGNNITNAYLDFDNISVRELYGNHATQSITASRPALSARKNILLATETLATQSITTLAAQYTLSFTGTGSVTLSGTATGTLTGTGTDRVSLTFTPTTGTLTLTVSGSVTKAQLELGAVAGPYQRVNTATDYDTVGWPRYLRGDGIDDFYKLPFMNLYGNGACSIVAARDAVSQATDTYIISERSTTDVDPKYFPSRQLASGGNMDSYIVSDEGTVRLDTTGSAFSGAKLAAIRSVVDTGSNIKLFKDGAVVADDNYTRAGTLTLNNTTLGASSSTTTSNYANMRLYGLIITKSALSDTDRRRCEQFLAGRLTSLGVTLS